MARKKPDSLAEGRQQIRAKYVKRTVIRGKSDGDELTPEDREWRLAKAIFLKANDASYVFISDVVRVNARTVRSWFEDPKVKERVNEFREDMRSTAIRYLSTFAVDLVQELVNIATDPDIDPKVRIQAICEALDRMGISKVNKSESIAATAVQHEFDISDPRGVLEQLRDNPQLASAAAQKLDELSAIVTEGSVK